MGFSGAFIGCFMIPFVLAGIGVAGYAGWLWHRHFDLAMAEYAETSCLIESKRLDEWVACNDNRHRRLGEAPARRAAACQSYSVGVFYVNVTPDLRTNPTGSLEAFEYADRMASQYTAASGNPFYSSIVENSTVPCWQRESFPDTVKLTKERATGSGQLLVPIFLTFFCCLWNGILCVAIAGMCTSAGKFRGINMEDQRDEEDISQEEDEDE